MDFIPENKMQTTGVDFVPLRWIHAGEAPSREPAESRGQEEGEGIALDAFESSLDEARRSAYDDGQADGEMKALRAMNEKLHSQISKWENSLSLVSSHIVQELQAFFSDFEQRTIELALAISRKIIQRELSKDPQLIIALVSKALSGLENQFRLALKLNPKDKNFMQNWLRESQVQFPHLTLVSDPEIEPGGFIVETDTRSMDHTLQSQLDRIGYELGSLYEQTST